MSGHRLAGVVLTGGASERMGVDKATLVVDGKPMAVRVADALWEAGCQPVDCQGGDVSAISEYGLEVFADRDPGRGPLAGVHEALVRHGDCDVVVAACDLIDLDGTTVRSLVAAGADDSHPDAVVAISGEQWHLVCWFRAGSAARVGELLDAGVTSYRDALERLQTIDVEVEATTIRNVNTPTDLEHRG